MLRIFKLPVAVMMIIAVIFGGMPKDMQMMFSGRDREELARYTGSPWADSDLVENISVFRNTPPDEDFHYYADKWLLCRNRLLGYTNWDLYSERSYDVEETALTLIKDDYVKGHDAELVKTMYERLTDWEERDRSSVNEIKEMTDEILETKSLKELTELLLSRSGLIWFDNFILLEAGPDSNDSMHIAVYISPYGLRLGDSAEYGRRSEFGDMTAGYRDSVFLHDAGKLGLSETEAKKHLEAAYKLEGMLAGYIPSSDDTFSAEYVQKSNNCMTYEELKELSVNYTLTDIVDHMGFAADCNYIVSEPEYLEYMNEIYTDENFEMIRSLIYVDAVETLCSYADSDIRAYEAQMHEKYYGYDNSITDDDMAYSEITDILYVPLQKLYVEEYGNEEDKRKLENVCRDVKATYRSMLEGNDWASEKTRDYAIKKLDKMEIHIGWPDKWEDYSKLSFEGKSLIGCIEALSDFKIEKDAALIGKERDPERWGDSFNLLQANAFYSPTENAICMPIGMMGEPFYAEDMPKEELYASIAGFWLGHEISHSFDSNGAQYDAEGNLKNWWSDEDKKEFDKRIKKLSDHMDTIVPFGSYHVRGSVIDTELAADMTGLQCALKMAENEADFDYDVFFRKYAQLNASIMPYSDELEMLQLDEHPLNYLRTNVPVQQFEEFYETYDVNEGDAMYLPVEDRFVIW